MTTQDQTVILLHVPYGEYADMARVYPDFKTRAAACAHLETVARPQDYRVSLVWRGKPDLVRGDRFLQRFARPRKEERCLTSP